jgi:hypothetical protein
MWRYTHNLRNYPGWHLHADSTGCNSISNLLDRMLESPYRSKRTLIVIPECLEGVYPEARSIGVSSLVIVFPNKEADSGMWSLEHKDLTLQLTIGHKKVLELKNSIGALASGKYDFAIGPEVNKRSSEGRKKWEEECLWFW